MNELPDKTKNRRKFIINFTYILILFGLSILLVRFALPALLPFIIALIVTVILKPVTKFLYEKCHLNVKAAAVIVALLFYATIGIVVLLLVIELIKYVGTLFQGLPGFYSETIVPVINDITERLNEFIAQFDKDNSISIEESASSIIASLGTTIGNFSSSVVLKLTNIATSLPNLLISVLITIISTTFMLIDFDLMKAFFRRQLPDKVNETADHVSKHLGAVLKKYILSYALIMFITFIELLIGLAAIGVKNSVLIAALVAVFDILPVVGSGTVLMPWAIVCLLTGNIGRCIGLVIVWAIISIIRNIIEPKIVGSSVGIHPLATLFAMLAGNFVYGGVGILLVPVLLALCQSLNNAGIIHFYTPVEEGDDTTPERGKVMTAVNSFCDRMLNAIASFFKKLFGRNKK
ncbi:MAG: sporulation integral membrane protein YtvI [Clostridia bacterium]|nr:sporulation integral membrane protein YtvI [Clostridia bacterium]